MIDTCLAYSEDQICGEAWWFKEVCGLRRRCRVPRHSFDLGYLIELPIRLGSSLRIISNAGQLYICSSSKFCQCGGTPPNGMVSPWKAGPTHSVMLATAS